MHTEYRLHARSYASRGCLRCEHDGACVDRAKNKFNNQKVCKAAENYYGANEIKDGIPKAHCSLVGWCDSNDVKASHIVPRILKSEELAQLYGVDEMVLECPQNAMDSLSEIKQFTKAIKGTPFA